MSLSSKPKKNFTEVTSSYFEDFKLIKQSMTEVKADKWINKQEYPNFDFGALARANAVQLITLARYGAFEVSQLAESLNNNQLSNYKLNYGPWKDCEPNKETKEEKQLTDC
jgi:hypothetical protein